MIEDESQAAQAQDSGEWRRRAMRATAWCLGLGAMVGVVAVFVARLLIPHLGSTAALIVVATVSLLGVACFAYAALDRSYRRLGESESTLEQHRSIYEDFFVNANDVFYTADKDGVFQVFNPAGERLTGYRQGETPANLFEIVAPEYLPLVREMAARKADGTPRTAYELEIITRDGRRVPVEVSTRLIYDEEGREAGVHGVLRDISERRAAEQQIRESEALLTILIENIPEGMVLLNEDFEIVRANAAASQLLEGHVDIIDGSLARIAGRPVEELLDLPPGNPSGVLEVGGPELKVLQVHGRRIRGDSFQGGVLVVRDTTLERRVGEQVQQHARLAAVGELAAGVAHDFNNVLQGIAVIAQALGNEQTLPAQAKSDVATIIDQTTTGSRVTRQLLDFSSQSPLTRRLVDLEEMLREVCPLLERSLPAKIAFTLDLPGHRVPVLADPALIQQMVANLVINARDAMPDGGHVDVRLSVVDANTDSRILPEVVQEGRWFELRVTDSGCGMTSEVRDRALEPFFTTKERGAGTGLGLSQVYGIVQQHDGQFLIASHPGAGTAVSVLLPEHRENADSSG